MSSIAFDEHATSYDSWFMQNEHVLESEVLLVAHALGEPGETLSIGCGTGLFEQLLRAHHGIDIRRGVEPAKGMAEIARKRGMEVLAAAAESVPLEDASFDTVLMNGTPSYLADVDRAFAEAFRLLRPGGRLVVLDVPAESSYGLLYRLAAVHGSWDHPAVSSARPPHPYPIAFVEGANWRSTPEKAQILERVGFVELDYAQTLTHHARYSDLQAEPPSPGYTRGDYVAIIARRPQAG